MSELYDAMCDVEKDLLKAKRQRSNIRKGANADLLQESQLAYADGLVAGLESALIAMDSRRLDKVPEGYVAE